jgi:hypothetical protein
LAGASCSQRSDQDQDAQESPMSMSSEFVRVALLTAIVVGVAMLSRVF